MSVTPISNTENFLKNLQANIVKGHGRKFAYHLFFKFNDGHAFALKEWITKFAVEKITSAHEQLEKTKLFKSGAIADGGTILTLSLSASGYKNLGIKSQQTHEAAFDAGMKSRATLLADNLADWEESFTGDIDMLIIVADDKNEKASHAAQHIITELAGKATLLLKQKGNVLKTKSGMGIEHFGYADGISQPLYLDSDISGQHSTNEWNDATDRGLLLVKDAAATAPDSFGSFLVFRKLEQNVADFKRSEGDDDGVPGVATPVLDVSGAKNKELSGAMIVGRFENSVPVVKSSTGQQTNPPATTNDFDYRDDHLASKCPFHAHIRLMNPRNGDAIAGDVSDHRITRRGIPYDEIGRIPENRITTISDDLLDNNQPTSGVGLLFMCYQSSIQNQFEILQGIWANTGQIGLHHIPGNDSVISQGPAMSKTLPVQWGKAPQSSPFTFGKFVTMKGGEYFFTPSLSFLRALQP
jgi:Dyp-type peroxidase family